MEKTAIELFAGVGGFRLGIENKENGWEVLWGNQWEPGKKTQDAFNCYSERFKKGIHSNEDISTVDAKEIPDHTLLVGGFPCQDYSVAQTKAKGIKGKKGVLFWEIKRIVEEKRPYFILLENVDRLLKSPAKQRGRDFGVMLTTFWELGYDVEWRVINAADYGHPQKRIRIFIFASRNDTKYSKKLRKKKREEILHTEGFFCKEFPILNESSEKHKVEPTKLDKNVLNVSNHFSYKFLNAGIMMNGEIYTEETIPNTKGIKQKTLGDILETGDVDEKYFLDEKKAKDIEYLKSAKRFERTTKTGFKYVYSEGKMSFPDPLDRPGRTMLTSEGSKNRSSHVVRDKKTGKLRILTPVECERLNEFPDNWTNTGMTERMRYFTMGNALVVGLIKKMGRTISSIVDEENKQ